MPISLGGDHMVTGPIVAALAEVHGPLNILHFDAHPDLYDDFEGDPLSHASPFARIMEAGHARRLVQFGIRTLNAPLPRPGRALRRRDRRDARLRAGRACRSPTRRSTSASTSTASIPPSRPASRTTSRAGRASASSCGCCTACPAPIVGADIVELNPSRDLNGVTATLAAKLVKELAALAAKARS